MERDEKSYKYIIKVNGLQIHAFETDVASVVGATIWHHCVGYLLNTNLITEHDFNIMVAHFHMPRRAFMCGRRGVYTIDHNVITDDTMVDSLISVIKFVFPLLPRDGKVEIVDLTPHRRMCYIQ
jgi:hypothetical protein